jgi:hypothetical protein
VNLGGLNLRLKMELQLGWEYYELMKGHVAMITAPEELGQILNRFGIMSIDRKKQEEV